MIGLKTTGDMASRLARTKPADGGPSPDEASHHGWRALCNAMASITVQGFISCAG